MAHLLGCLKVEEEGFEEVDSICHPENLTEHVRCHHGGMRVENCVFEGIMQVGANMVSFKVGSP